MEPLPDQLADVLEPEPPFDLEAALDEADLSLVTAEPERVGPWTIDGDRTAEWVAAKFVAAAARRGAVARQADEWRDRITEWQLEATRRDEATIAWATDRLTRYMVEQREEHGRKSIPLPSAKVRSTARRAAVMVDDEAVLLKWLDENVEPAVRDLVVKRRVGVSELRDVLAPVETETGWTVVDTATGAVADGATVKPPAITVSVTPTVPVDPEAGL